jgi:FAD/FMN-containing dehydrogenase
MRSVKAAFDPVGLLNPGVLLAVDRCGGQGNV